MHEMLKTAFGDNTMGRTQTFEWFSRFKCWSNTKNMLVIFSGCEGIVHQEFVPPGQTVNQHYYLEVLKRLREQVRRKHPERWGNQDWLLHHDNVLAQLLCLCRDFWPLKTWLWPPTFLTRLIWPLAMSSCF
jgi:hypothetical protein